MAPSKMVAYFIGVDRSLCAFDHFEFKSRAIFNELPSHGFVPPVLTMCVASVTHLQRISVSRDASGFATNFVSAIVFASNVDVVIRSTAIWVPVAIERHIRKPYKSLFSVINGTPRTKHSIGNFQ